MRTRIFALAEFDRFARKAKIDDAVLVDAIERAERGLVDVELGGGIVKLRLARPGQGRSGGYRTIVVLKIGDRAIYLYGFAKNDFPNITGAALEAFKINASDLNNATESALLALMAAGILREIIR